MNVYHTIAVARAGLPRLIIAQRVVDKIVGNALVYNTETGESLVGLAIKPLDRVEPDLYVMETIPPDESAIRRGAYFEQGDELQGDIFAWFYDNWTKFPEYHRADGNAQQTKWDAPLGHLGDWHKHPGDLVEPSWGDTETAFNHIFDDKEGSPQLLAMLATVWDRATAEKTVLAGDEARPLKIPVDDNTIIRIDSWYMSRRTRRFVRLTPTVAPDNTLPSLPAISWHLKDTELARREIEALGASGYTVSLYQHNADQKPPLETCLTLDKPKSKYFLIIVTQADYPASRPNIRVAHTSAAKNIPESGDFFMGMWSASKPLPEDAYPAWTPKNSLLDLAQAVEERLAAKPIEFSTQERKSS